MNLAWIYTHHAEALEAELMSQYHLELEDEDDPESSSLRKLWVYWSQLPPMNRITQEILEIEPDERIWGTTEPILADLIDAVNYNSYILAQSNTKQRVRQPKPYPRPDYGKKARARLDTTPKRDRLPGTVTYIPREG